MFHVFAAWCSNGCFYLVMHVHPCAYEIDLVLSFSRIDWATRVLVLVAMKLNG